MIASHAAESNLDEARDDSKYVSFGTIVSFAGMEIDI